MLDYLFGIHAYAPMTILAVLAVAFLIRAGDSEPRTFTALGTLALAVVIVGVTASLMFLAHVYTSESGPVENVTIMYTF